MTNCFICNDPILIDEDIRVTNQGIAHLQCAKDAIHDGELYEEDKGGEYDDCI